MALTTLQSPILVGTGTETPPIRSATVARLLVGQTGKNAPHNANTYLEISAESLERGGSPPLTVSWKCLPGSRGRSHCKGGEALGGFPRQGKAS
jgi:hypothetical protein